MRLKEACATIINQLIQLLEQIHEVDYVRPIPSLSNSSLGQHMRHTVEFFMCLEQGLGKGVVNYDLRSHDEVIESDKVLALVALGRIMEFVNRMNEDTPLQLEFGYDVDKAEFMRIETNYFRELVYNIEHAVHHMALIKIGVREIAPYASLPSDFGVAASTVRHKTAVNIQH